MRILVNDFCGHPFQIDLSRELANRGHQVWHVYFADNKSTPKGNTQSGGNGSSGCVVEGLHVSVPFAKHSIRSRRKADIAYGRAVAERVTAFEPDVVISANMPLDAQKILQEAARRQNAKFVFWLQDVYSSAIRFVLRKKVGRIGDMVSALYERMEKQLLKSSDAVICIAPSFAKLATEWGVEESRVAVIENWAPLGEIVPTAKDNAWSREHNVDSKFCFVYSGTLGMKHRPELLLALAEYLETREDACLVVVAAGAGADWLREHASSIRKGVLTLLPFQPYDRLSEVLGASDVLIALLNSDAGSFAVPSKTLAYMCAGRPMMLAAPRNNHAAAVIERENAGLVISPESADDIVRAAGSLMDRTEARNQFAANARAYAEQSFDIVPIADRFLDVFYRTQNRTQANATETVSASIAGSAAFLKERV
jgi:colanic acid biosynthesis glycosyl transferase WcaI